MAVWSEIFELDAIWACALAWSLALIWLHKELTFPCDLFPLTRKAQDPDKDSHVTEERVEEELTNVQVRAWKSGAAICVHLQLGILVVSVVDLHQRGDFNSLIWMLASASCYALYVLTVTGAVQMKLSRVRLVCHFFHSSLLVFSVGTALESKEDFIWRHSLSVCGQIIVALMFPHARAVAMYSPFFLAAHVVACAHVFGYDAAFSMGYLMQNVVLTLCAMAVPLMTENIIRDRIAESFKSDEAHSLVMAFRQMLRGVCDGDVLLDDDLKTCGDVSALKRILGTHGDLKGRKFQDFLVQQEEAILKFETFVANAVATGEASGPPPKCLRVLLQTEGPREIPVDVFHVALPDLYGTNATYHLLAISEDAESHLARLQSQGAPRANSDSVEFYNELSELTLLLNASTTDIDIEEATVHFARKAAKHDTGWGMPTLRKLIRPLDWQALEAQIRIVAREAKLHRGKKGKRLPELMLRLPGAAEPKTYLRARSASVERVYSGMLAPGEPAYLYLQLSKFNQGRRGLGTDKRRLEGVEEDCANETKDV